MLAVPLLVMSQKVKFTAKAPETVVVGQPFQLQYSVNSTDRVSRPQTASFDTFDLLNEPSRFVSNSYQFINGKSSQISSTVYTYMLMAKESGKFSIAPASITVDGKQYKSNSLSIKVLPVEETVPKNQNVRQGNGSSASISKDDIFFRAIISKTNLQEQEMLLLTYKIYYKVNLVNIAKPQKPNLNGFITHEIDVDKKQDIEHYNGQNYYTAIISQMLISPQKTGRIVVEPFRCKAIIRQRQTIRDPRSIFGAYTTHHDVERQLSSNALTFYVKPLPEPKPSDFCGASGSLSMTSSISATEVEANNSITLKLKIKGTGNLKLIKTPKIEFPTDFEQYDPKVDNNFSATTAGFSGSKTIEYLVIPRHSGTYQIPAVTLSYYDLSSNKYKTLSTEAYELKVSKDNGKQAVTKVFDGGEQVKQLASDICYIKRGDLNIRPLGDVFTGSLLFWLLFLLPMLLGVGLIVVFNKKAKENANIAFSRNKKANKVARKRLKNASNFLKDSNKDKFYDEMLSAVWLYVSDKLNITLSDLNKERATTGLQQCGVPENLIAEAMQLLSDCEFERYAISANSNVAMENIYNSAIEIIGKLENVIRK